MVRFDPVSDRKQLWGHLVWFAGWVGVTAVGLYLEPSPHGHGTHQQLGLAPCPSVLMFNRPCPGCGLTTSFSSMVHGQWMEAFDAHFFGPIFYGLFTLSALACLYGFIRGQRFNTESKAFNAALGALVVVYLVFSGIRFAVKNDYRPVYSEQLKSTQSAKADTSKANPVVN